MKLGEQYTANKMDEYDKKFAEMQKYIPFLEAMIERLQNVKDKSREIQLQKMQSLHGILSNSKRKLKIETLQRCEDVLQKLHNKVEKFQGNAPGLSFPHKKSEANFTPSLTASEDVSFEHFADANSQEIDETIEGTEIHETPASPSPPVSPDSGSQVAPIIIPTERSDFIDDKLDSKPASPDPVDTLPTKAPIIIPTERTSSDLGLSSGTQRSSGKRAEEVSFSEWDMLEENENQIARNKNWQSTIASSGNDVTAAIKLIGSKLPQKINEGRPHVPISIHSSRHIPTVPVPSLGGSRRLSSVLEKNRLMGINLDIAPSDSRSESPVNIPDARLKSPDGETLFLKHKNASPRHKDVGLRPTSKSSAPLLISPPPVSTEPPLSMEDLAELLNEEADDKAEKKSERLREEATKFTKDSNKQESSTLGVNSKDSKSSKSFILAQEDVDSESERRWEEIDKHIVKLTSRKCLPNVIATTASSTKAEASKLSETKGPPSTNSMHSASTSSANVDKVVDNRTQPSSPNSKMEHRYADNYERHPRHLRDNHNHDNVKDKPNVHAHGRPFDEDMSNPIPIHHSGLNKSDGRNPTLYQRRQGNVGSEMAPPKPDVEFRAENSEYFNRQMSNHGHWSSVHSSINANDFCNNQWPQSSNFNNMPNPSAQPYQHSIGMHQELWNVGSSRDSIHMDPHQINDGQLRPNHFPSNPNTGNRPLISPNSRQQDKNHILRPDEVPNVDVSNVTTIQPLISPTRFSVGPQYRNFQGENRPYEPPFDRGIEYSHTRQSWDPQASRSNDVPYRGENEGPCNVIGSTDGSAGLYSRPSTPCPWNRDRDRCSGSRGRSAYYNDKNRGESRSNFNRDTRDTRRPEWSRDNHNEWDNCNRFSRDNRNVSDRDPRVRAEHNVTSQNPSQSRDNATSVRDPRLAKDKHFPPVKGKDPVYNDRDSKKRSTAPPFLASARKVKEKVKSPPKHSESVRRVDVENSGKQTQEKLAKDKMQSPLESLYGVIDTKAKSAQGYCLQNFKIPKIKRNESSESPTSSHAADELKVGECAAQLDKPEGRTNNSRKDKDDTTSEVSSSSDGNGLLETWNEGEAVSEKKEDPKQPNASKKSAEDKTELNIGELALTSISTTTSTSSGSSEKSKKDGVEPDGVKLKDEVTQEWVEALIRKSFEFGEGKKFVEQAKFMQKLGEVLQAKKLKKIKKIIESETESSSSDKDDTLETKKVHMRKKRRVIVSDSSDEESLAERLGILNTTNKPSVPDSPADINKIDAKKNIEEITSIIESSDIKPCKHDITQEDGTSTETQDVTQENESKNENANSEKMENVTTDSVSNETVDDKENASKTPKVKAKRRNSLEMLQEDIREMFISDGVVAATGHRLCRTQKENQQNVNANASNQNASTVKKEELGKRDVEINSETEGSVSSSKQKKTVKSRSSEENSKLKSKSKREAQRITRQRLKQYNESSDSEEDQPLALRTELVQTSNALSNQDMSNEESDVLRRSKRIINKETIKEPRVVVEKTDISKMDSAKVMFDSSSDESFGIDVSELTAAMDISLHPEKPTEPVASDTAEKKNSKQSPFRKNLKKKISKLMLTEGNGENVSLTDEESVTSDISIASSIASGKKANASSSRLEASSNEELLSNILVGLVPTKNDPDKDTSVADKGSDEDIDDDISDQLPVETNRRKSSTKKKKKKCNWQMGILSKKKRKKAPTSCSPRGDSDVLNSSSELKTYTTADTRGVSEDKVGQQCDSFNDTNENTSGKDEDNVKKTDACCDSVSSNQKTNDSLVSCGSVSNTETSCNTDSPKVSAERNTETGTGETSKDVVKTKEELDKSICDIDINKLLDYAFTGQERYKCLLCLFTGKNIVHHYKLSHPGKEILISRLTIADAQLAIENAKEDAEKTLMKPLTNETRKFSCRLCSFFAEAAAKVAMETFYEHCTTHTGEYRFRCRSCPYQAVAKSSMRTHYYKVCRKFNDTFNEAITEDEIPEENCIYGYLCSICNYVQLKKCNLEEHTKLWHKDNLNANTVKIKMSLDSVEEPVEDLPDEKIKEELPQSSKENLDGSTNGAITSIEQNDDTVSEVELVKNKKTDDSNDEIKGLPEKKLPKEKGNTMVQCDKDKKKKSPQLDVDSGLPTGNLSVFVCPPELEKKEVEIQLERKRKMQEIIQNIGIKLQKDATKKGFSIIDKLKDKMKTNLVVINNENDSNPVPDSSCKVPTNQVSSSRSTSSRNSTTESPLPSSKLSVTDSKTNLTTFQEVLVNEKQSEGSASKTAPSGTKRNSVSEVDPLDTKVRDPLRTLDQKKSYESDTSDNENMRESAHIYESDSSSEQSDNEPHADVNTILKETSNIDASSKAPMLTTIQRLAAQLKATKPLCKDENSSKSEDIADKTFFLDFIPQAPDVLPIGTIKRFVGKLENSFHEVLSEENDDTNPPKNFIRLRRLSGDILSLPTQLSGVQDDESTKNNESEFKNTSDNTETVLTADGEEECSFFKIENVVSLAPRANSNDAESPIIHDIRKAVETSPIKSKGVSVLKKSNTPLILTRLNAVAITQPLTKNIQTVQSTVSETVKLIPVKNLSPTGSATTTQLTTNFIPIAPKSKIIQVDKKLPFSISLNKSTCTAPATTRTMTVGGTPQSSNVNFKIVKLVRTPTILKPKDSITSSPTAIKLKSADAYNAMLKTAKLTHLYKCMARDCSFTSDILIQYHQHYLQHVSDSEKKKMTPPFDYQKCAYCYMVLEDWNHMKVHLEEKHTHCRYQCSYCFYRAIAPSYVQIHQAISHPGHHGILLGKLVKDVPLKEDINRHDHINPYVCHHDCTKFFYVPESFVAHLKHKHGSLGSAFKCHICRSTCTKAEQLITHYKVHGFYKYHCLYCLNGSDTVSDLHIHLSTFHCNRLPQILERSLPPQFQAGRNRDVIDQLVVRSLDENFKIIEEIIDVDSDGKDGKEIVTIDVTSSSSPHQIISSQLSKEINMLNKDKNEALNKSMSNLFGSSNNQNISSTSTSPLQDKTTSVNENSSESIPNKAFESTNNSNISIPSISNEESTDKNVAGKSVKTTSIVLDRSSIESMKLLGKFDCSDEFINMNLLDNPDFLKNVNSRSSDTSVSNTTTAVDECKAEDSDVEILNIDDTDISTTSDATSLSRSNEKDNSDTNEKLKVDICSQESDTKEQSCSDFENLNMSTDTNGKPASTKTDKPLTLEDIKDTGFTGIKLYKCGYEACDYGAQTAALLRTHVKECSLRGDNKNLNCAHCNKRFIKIGFLLEHLKLHGLKRFGCSFCKMRCTVGYQAMAHMKAKHKFANGKLVPADPKNPSVDGLFIVQPIQQTGERKGKKRKSTKSVEKDGEKVATDTEKLSFNPDEIESLPRQAIYNREVQCAVCRFTTKVRTNIIRHLRLHAKYDCVPESGPVNPVPCLDKKERMFDKMVNLASSSHQNGRMGGKPKECNKDNDDEFIPKFVPEHKRYVCGVAECNYLTVDEAMLRYHLKALHSEEPYFRCPHCPQPLPGQEGLNIAIDKMGVHLKMHDTRLYKCSHCNHHHYHRHVVERHLSDKHPEKRPFVKVIRELESTENNQQFVQEEIEEEVPDPDGNHWKCNICDYKCVYKAEMVNHTTTAHDEKCQYKCTSCSFKTSGKILFEQHINNKHSNDPNVDYILIYQRIKGVNKRNVDNVEQCGQDEPFDTTPLWRRDMPRVRHIRGILLEEENELTMESSLKTAKRKSDVELSTITKPAKIKPGKSSSLDDVKQTKEKSKRSLSCDKGSSDIENPNEISDANAKTIETKAKSSEDQDFKDTDIGRFGPYGKAEGNMYVCTLCTQFKTKYKHDMRDHLYRELNYARWHCQECGYLSVNRYALFKHFAKHHNGERSNHEPLSPDDDIEDWVGTLLKRQTLMIKAFLSKQAASNTNSSTTANTSESDTKSSSKIVQNVVAKVSKTANVANKSSPNLRDSTIQNTIIDADKQENSNKDNGGLRIATKDDTSVRTEEPEIIPEADKAETEETQEKPLICKHCKMTFTGWRGFKLHVQLTHLKRLGFVCPYCDRSTNSETLMRQHIRSKHPGYVEKIVQNPAAGGPELTKEFWQKEYGVIFPKKSRKRKRKMSGDDTADNDNHDQIELQEKCPLCGFNAMNLAGLKAHMRIHVKNTLKCSYCAFTTSIKAELWEHWELNHPFTHFQLEDMSMPESSEESGNVQHDTKPIIDDYSDHMEEEYVSDIKNHELLYSCVYCSFHSKSLDAVQNHWDVVHKEPKLSNDSPKLKSNFPFRYKQIRMSIPLEKSSTKTPSSKSEADIPYEVYLQESHSDVEVLETARTKQGGWICQWCFELCDSEVKMNTHHSMFHSHLRLNFKQQDKNKMPSGYKCPECAFITIFIDVMKHHVLQHIGLYKCKYCDKTFDQLALISSHHVEEHGEMEFRVEPIRSYNPLIEKIMCKVKWQKSNTDMNNSDENDIVVDIPKPAVARKSTAKSTVRSNLIPYKIKAVARKSTNPHSRHLSNTKANDREQVAKSSEFSYYGIPKTPINLAKLNTYMVVGGHRMKVNCTTLAQLININPKIVLKDLKYDVKNNASLKKFK